MRPLVRRLSHLAAVLLVTSFIAFFSIRLLPGDTAEAILGESATPATVAALRASLHLDDPIWTQFLRWFGGVLTGDFGRSARNGQPVLDSIVQRIPVSVELMIAAQVVALAVAIPVAVYAAYHRGRTFDRASGAAAFVAISIPDFVLGIVLILVVALTLGLVPATGWIPLSESLMGNLQTVVLPAVVLASSQVAIYQRILRNDVVATLQEDYIATARTKGLGTGYILFRHALRPSSFSLVTLAGINVGRLIGGAVVVEVLFALPGLGQLIVASLASRDYVMVQGVVLFIALAYVAVNALVDVLYVVLDPRVRASERARA